MKIYTKSGDDGSTGLLGGSRVSKAAIRIESYGAVDELNAWVGLLADQPVHMQRAGVLREIQGRLFTIGAHLAVRPGKTIFRIPSLTEDDLQLLEAEIDDMEAGLSPLRAFVLPGGHPVVSFGHIARTVCRRAERAVVRLQETEPVAPEIVRYLNRLSDYLFVLSRMAAKESGAAEITWEHRK